MKATPTTLLMAMVLTHSAWAHDAATSTAPPVEQPIQIEPDADSINARAPVRDPWENFNRKIHSFNNAADSFVLRPLAVGYDKAMPDAAKAGVSRFFSNLGTPVTAMNQALQGRPGDAAQSVARFAANTTVGIGGIFDPASAFGMPRRGGEDFGQTLATWGWSDSNYLVVPLLGPRTVRDTLGMLGGQPLSPLSQIQDSGVAMGLQMLEVVDGRTQMLPIDRFRRDAIDDYIFVRDAWAQRRNRQIHEDLRGDSD